MACAPDEIKSIAPAAAQRIVCRIVSSLRHESGIGHKGTNATDA
jgi:hypothetical protein